MHTASLRADPDQLRRSTATGASGRAFVCQSPTQPRDALERFSCTKATLATLDPAFSLLRGDLLEAPWISQAECRQFEPAHPLSHKSRRTLTKNAGPVMDAAFGIAVGCWRQPLTQSVPADGCAVGSRCEGRRHVPSTWGFRFLAGVRSELNRKRSFASKSSSRDRRLLELRSLEGIPPIRDDSPAQRRPEWSSTPNPPSLGVSSITSIKSITSMTYLASVSVPDTTRRSPWLVDPISRTLPPFLVYQRPPSGYHR
jgi:hypothetical protein